MTGTILNRMQTLVERAPENIFSVLYHRDAICAISYRNIWQHSHHVAQRLITMNILPGDVIAIMLPHTPGLYYAFCKRRRENPSLKRPGSPVAPE